MFRRIILFLAVHEFCRLLVEGVVMSVVASKNILFELVLSRVLGLKDEIVSLFRRGFFRCQIDLLDFNGFFLLKRPFFRDIFKSLQGFLSFKFLTVFLLEVVDT